MISKKMQDAINEQINRELFSEYLYISMQAWFANQNLDGMANWMDAQGKEERFHAMKFFNYLVDQGIKFIQIGSVRVTQKGDVLQAELRLGTVMEGVLLGE